MFGSSPFYHQLTRRYTAVFGTLFNDIKIQRFDNDGNVIQTMKVPLAYAPAQKFISMLEQDPNKDAPAISLPRMAFEITNIVYDPERRLGSNSRAISAIPLTKDSVYNSLGHTPYNLTFNLYIITKYQEDGFKILEQILPYFTPEWTPSMKLIDDLNLYLDVPIVLNDVQTEDIYEANYEERRALLWTLTFTMKGYFFGPRISPKVIKFAKVDTYASMTANTHVSRVTVQPGLDAEGRPTKDIANTVPYTEISYSDDWDFVVQIEDNLDG